MQEQFIRTAIRRARGLRAFIVSTSRNPDDQDGDYYYIRMDHRGIPGPSNAPAEGWRNHRNQLRLVATSTSKDDIIRRSSEFAFYQSLRAGHAVLRTIALMTPVTDAEQQVIRHYSHRSIPLKRYRETDEDRAAFVEKTRTYAPYANELIALLGAHILNRQFANNDIVRRTRWLRQCWSIFICINAPVWYGGWASFVHTLRIGEYNVLPRRPPPPPHNGQPPAEEADDAGGGGPNGGAPPPAPVVAVVPPPPPLMAAAGASLRRIVQTMKLIAESRWSAYELGTPRQGGLGRLNDFYIPRLYISDGKRTSHMQRFAVELAMAGFYGAAARAMGANNVHFEHWHPGTRRPANSSAAVLDSINALSGAILHDAYVVTGDALNRQTDGMQLTPRMRAEHAALRVLRKVVGVGVPEPLATAAATALYRVVRFTYGMFEGNAPQPQVVRACAFAASTASLCVLLSLDEARATVIAQNVVHESRLAFNANPANVYDMDSAVPPGGAAPPAWMGPAANIIAANRNDMMNHQNDPNHGIMHTLASIPDISDTYNTTQRARTWNIAALQPQPQGPRYRATEMRAATNVDNLAAGCAPVAAAEGAAFDQMDIGDHFEASVQRLVIEPEERDSRGGAGTYVLYDMRGPMPRAHLIAHVICLAFHYAVMDEAANNPQGIFTVQSMVGLPAGDVRRRLRQMGFTNSTNAMLDAAIEVIRERLVRIVLLHRHAAGARNQDNAVARNAAAARMWCFTQIGRASMFVGDPVAPLAIGHTRHAETVQNGLFLLTYMPAQQAIGVEPDATHAFAAALFSTNFTQAFERFYADAPNESDRRADHPDFLSATGIAGFNNAYAFMSLFYATVVRMNIRWTDAIAGGNLLRSINGMDADEQRSYVGVMQNVYRVGLPGNRFLTYINNMLNYRSDRAEFEGTALAVPPLEQVIEARSSELVCTDMRYVQRILGALNTQNYWGNTMLWRMSRNDALYDQTRAIFARAVEAHDSKGSVEELPSAVWNRGTAPTEPSSAADEPAPSGAPRRSARLRTIRQQPSNKRDEDDGEDDGDGEGALVRQSRMREILS